ncbi:MAG: sulfotransferase [Flavobacteriaceae bacterium]
MIKRIIILASERSGTNLLRVLLGNHKDISAPVQGHFFNCVHVIKEYYGDLNKAENAKILLNHFIKIANHPFSDWKLELDVAKVIEKYKVNSIATAFDAIHREYTIREGKRNYAVKDNDMYNHIEHTEELKKDGDVYYINLYRDPRDHTVSWLKKPLFLHTPFDVAVKWNKEQSKIKEVKKRINMFDMRYEDLIADTPKVMTELFNYMDMPVDEKAFATDPKNVESKRNPFWENLSKPIIKDNKKNYKGLLKGKDLKIVETICKQNMLDLGYIPDTSANWKDYFGFYKKNVLPKKRAASIKENKEFYETEMKDLKSKLDLLKELRNDVQTGK